jgi:hypothetical protein
MLDKETGYETEWFECRCHSDEHVLKFSFDTEALKNHDIPEMYVSIYLSQYMNIWKRAWIAIKYIFGYRSQYGDWDTFLIKPQDAELLIQMLERYRNLSLQKSSSK